MSNEPKSGPRPNTSLYLGIGIGLGLALALANHPTWVTVSGGVVFGVTFGLVGGLMQARRAKR